MLTDYRKLELDPHSRLYLSYKGSSGEDATVIRIKANIRPGFLNNVARIAIAVFLLAHDLLVIRDLKV